jgi:hypothetical protein
MFKATEKREEKRRKEVVEMFDPNNWYEQLYSPEPLFEMLLGEPVHIDRGEAPQNFEEEEA